MSAVELDRGAVTLRLMRYDRAISIHVLVNGCMAMLIAGVNPAEFAIEQRPAPMLLAGGMLIGLMLHEVDRVREVVHGVDQSDTLRSVQ